MDTLTALDTSERTTPVSVVVLRILWRDRRRVLRFLVGGLVLSVAIVFLIPSNYQSTVQLMPPGWQSTTNTFAAPFSGFNMAASGGAGLAGSLLNSRSPSGPLLGIVASRTMQDDLIQRFNLQRVYHERYLSDARKILTRRTDANEDKPTGIISITVTDRDPVRARDLASAYVDELNKLVVTMDTSAAHRERAFLEQRVQDIQLQIEAAEQQLGHFSSRTGTMEQSAQSKAMLDAVTNVQGELIAAESTLHGLQAVYSDESVRVKQAKARVGTLSQELHKLEGVQGKGSSEADSSQEFPSLRQLPVLGVTYADLYRRTRTLEVAYELLSRELEAAKIEEAESIPSVKVLDPPVAARKRSFPPRLLLIAVGAVLSLLAGALWILGCEVWSSIDPADPVKALAKEICASFRRTEIRP